MEIDSINSLSSLGASVLQDAQAVDLQDTFQAKDRCGDRGLR